MKYQPQNTTKLFLQVLQLYIFSGSQNNNNLTKKGRCFRMHELNLHLGQVRATCFFFRGLFSVSIIYIHNNTNIVSTAENNQDKNPLSTRK
jgi:hypothetical protein